MQTTHRTETNGHWSLASEHLQFQDRPLAATLIEFATYFCVFIKRGPTRFKILSISVNPHCVGHGRTCIGCKDWLHTVSLLVYPVYIPICYFTAASNGYVFKFLWVLGKEDLSLLVDLPKWRHPELQQHNSAGCCSDSVQAQPWYILGEFTCSWQESFTVDKFWSKSFVHSFTKTKGGITPREGIKWC